MEHIAWRDFLGVTLILKLYSVTLNAAIFMPRITTVERPIISF